MEDCLVFQMITEDGNVTLRQQVLHLAVLGTLYQKLQEFIEYNSLDGSSLFLSALAAALREQLSSFLLLLSYLERQINGLYSRPSLIQLRVETLGAKQLLTWLVTASEACRFRLGCNVLSTLYTLLCSGNPQAHCSLAPIFLRVSEVFYKLMKEWFTTTKVTDPYEEFFIGVDISKPFLNPEYCVVRELMVPQFLTTAQVERIAKIGKNYAVLKGILVHKRPLADMHIGLDEVISVITKDAHIGLNAWGVDGEMHIFLLELEKEVSKELVFALLTKGKLSLHLEILTGFFLLRQNGFAAHLTDNIFDVLSVSAPLVSKQNLTEKFRMAINNTHSFEQEDIKLEEKLNIHFDPQPEHDLAWDSFEISYEVENDNPVTLVWS
ncbi:uncharacterized protein LOC132205028 [Neocloeon triangulifer]|uniref:uncharacterized protein LOC132205028 n=1 Tax=Neocloeon triangulifer TaxID=2078957 RepID=UPI00286F4CB9|nr:uncharacterized protein LOC132205028 [Neocloeon triangulifer]